MIDLSVREHRLARHDRHQNHPGLATFIAFLEAPRDSDLAANLTRIVRCFASSKSLLGLEVITLLNEQLKKWWCSTESELIALADRFLQDSEQATDIVQDVALELLQRSPEFNSEGHFRGWTYRAVTWRAFDRLRKDRRLRSLEFEPPAADSATEKWLAVESVREVLPRLPCRQRSVVEQMLNGKEDEEIASALGLKEPSVRSLRRFAIKRLIEELGERSGYGDNS